MSDSSSSVIPETALSLPMFEIRGYVAGCVESEALMGWDHRALEWLRHKRTQHPLWLLRTYTWPGPTASVGVHQSQARIQSFMARQQNPHLPVVQRPTGGRALLHGQDVSFSILTNAADILRLSVAASTCEVLGLCQAALDAVGEPLAPVSPCTPTDPQAQRQRTHHYRDSVGCMDTILSSDLVMPKTGEKRLALVQARRQGAVLFQGSWFPSERLAPDAQARRALCAVFLRALTQMVARMYPHNQ